MKLLTAIKNNTPLMYKIKIALFLIAVSSILGFVFWIKWMVGELDERQKKIGMLEANVSTLQSNATILRNNYLTCQTSNTANAKTIEDLMAERDDAKAAIERLVSQNKKNDVYISGLQDRIRKMRADTANNGPLAPVLRETIRDIQENRQ